MAMTVLVVDDSVTMVMSLKTTLAMSGFQVETASNGKMALERLQAGIKPNLILTDINMPVMGGILHRSREYAGMPHHVGVGEIEDDHVVPVAVEPPEQFFCNEEGAHLRLFVIGGDFLGRGDQAALLAGKGYLVAAVEEKGDMGRYFSVSAMRSCLRPALPSNSPRMFFSSSVANATGRPKVSS